MKKSYKALVSDAAVFAAGNMLTKLIQFLLLPMYTALLTTEQYGIGELVNNTAELLYPLCCLGVYEGVFRFSIDRDSDNKAVLSTGIGIALSLLPVVAAAGIFGYSFTGFDYTWQLVILCFITSFKVIFLQFSKGIGKTRLYASSGVLGALTLFCAGYLFLGVFGMGVNGYLLALILSQGIQLLLVFFGAKVWRFASMGAFSKPLARDLLRYSLPMIPNALAWWFVNLSGRYIVMFSQGADVAGLYTAASKLPAVMNMVVTIFQQSWQIFSAREYDASDSRSSFGTVFKVFTAFLLCAGSLVIALTVPLSRIMLSGDFFAAYVFVPFLMLSSVISGYSTYFGTLYNAAKNNSMIFVTTMVGAFVNVVLGALLSFAIGAWGPIIAGVVAYVLISLMRAYDTKKLINIDVDIPYQVIGLGLLLVECVFISFGFAFATLVSIVCSLLFNLFTLYRYRKIVKTLLKSLKVGH